MKYFQCLSHHIDHCRLSSLLHPHYLSQLAGYLLLNLIVFLSYFLLGLGNQIVFLFVLVLSDQTALTIMRLFQVLIFSINCIRWKAKQYLHFHHQVLGTLFLSLQCHLLVLLVKQLFAFPLTSQLGRMVKEFYIFTFKFYLCHIFSQG